MSRSYKHTPVYKGDKDRFAKKLANRRIRRRTKRNPYDSLTGKSNHYRKEIEESNIPDVPLEERRQIKKIGFAC